LTGPKSGLCALKQCAIVCQVIIHWVNQPTHLIARFSGSFAYMDVGKERKQDAEALLDSESLT